MYKVITRAKGDNTAIIQTFEDSQVEAVNAYLSAFAQAGYWPTESVFINDSLEGIDCKGVISLQRNNADIPWNIDTLKSYASVYPI